MPRRVITVLYGSNGQRALLSEQDRSPAEERAAFNALRGNLPPDVVRAELIDTDNRGLILTHHRQSDRGQEPFAPPPPERKKRK
jgi:hypothetical protein